MTFSIEGKTPLQFWEGLYANASGEMSGNPSTALARFAGDRTPGVALDLGCAKGDDAVWQVQSLSYCIHLRATYS